MAFITLIPHDVEGGFSVRPPKLGGRNRYCLKDVIAVLDSALDMEEDFSSIDLSHFLWRRPSVHPDAPFPGSQAGMPLDAPSLISRLPSASLLNSLRAVA